MEADYWQNMSLRRFGKHSTILNCDQSKAEQRIVFNMISLMKMSTMKNVTQIYSSRHKMSPFFKPEMGIKSIILDAKNYCHMITILAYGRFIANTNVMKCSY